MTSSPDPSTPPPGRVPAADRVHSYVKERILGGDLPGGTMISEGQIAEATGVSRTPVREGFLRLQAEGMLVLYPKRGALVQPIAPGEIQDVLDARRMVEAHTALVLCGLPDARRSALADALEDLAAQQAEADAHGDHAAYSSLDVRFHQELVTAAGNDLITAFAMTLRERQQRIIASTVRRSVTHATDFIAGHRRLAQHLRAGDSAAYTAELDAHLTLAEEALS